MTFILSALSYAIKSFAVSSAANFNIYVEVKFDMGSLGIRGWTDILQNWASFVQRNLDH